MQKHIRGDADTRPKRNVRRGMQYDKRQKDARKEAKKTEEKSHE